MSSDTSAVTSTDLRPLPSLPTAPTIGGWLAHYREGGALRDAFTTLAALLATTDGAIWIHRASTAELEPQLARLELMLANNQGDLAKTLTELPLFGVPFVVKDNIDIAGVTTTAACSAFGYNASASATAVQRLLDHGAVWVGKTNLDQFATGLSGTRSPYGRVSSTRCADRISGGSSSGSAVAVSLGLIPFSLGTDTAGSGRVPAAFNNIVGLKPTPGRVSTRGVVPACRSIDCVSIFALTVEDAASVLAIIEGEDEGDPGSAFHPRAGQWAAGLRIGYPDPVHLDPLWTAGWRAALDTFSHMGHHLVPRNTGDLEAVGNSLYGGPWVAERLVTIQALLDRQPEVIEPVVRGIIAGGAAFSAADAHRATYTLQAARATLGRLWKTLDVLLVPTVAEHPTFAQIDADPVGVNARLGRYTNFVNLLGWCAIAIPAGLTADGRPFGITLIAANGQDGALARVASQWQTAMWASGSQQGRSAATLGATTIPAAEPGYRPIREPASEPTMSLAVVGAHLTGMPLNGQLTDAGGRLSQTTTTSPRYRLHALPASVPPKPGLERVNDGGSAIIVEVWDIPLAAIGGLLAKIPPPLGLGNLELADGRWVKGFICEPSGLIGATDISTYGGWRAYIKALSS